MLSYILICILSHQYYVCQYVYMGGQAVALIYYCYIIIYIFKKINADIAADVTFIRVDYGLLIPHIYTTVLISLIVGFGILCYYHVDVDDLWRHDAYFVLTMSWMVIIECVLFWLMTYRINNINEYLKNKSLHNPKYGALDA